MSNLFPHYAPLIAALPDRSLTKADLCTPAFLLHEEHVRHETLAIYYAPFDYVNPGAKIVLVGITPGWQHMEIAFRKAGEALRHGATLETASAFGKQEAIFEGSMRKTLAQMLDGLAIYQMLGIGSCSQLFTDQRHLLHAEGAVRYPVLVNGGNYTGYKPPLLQTPALRWYVDHVLAESLQGMDGALIIPLGKSVGAAVQTVVARGLVAPNQCLFGLPHPSGANAHRLGQYQAVKDHLQEKVMRWFEMQRC